MTSYNGENKAGFERDIALAAEWIDGGCEDMGDFTVALDAQASAIAADYEAEYAFVVDCIRDAIESRDAEWEVIYERQTGEVNGR